MKLGKAFSDNVIQEKTKVTYRVDREDASWWVGSGRALLFVTLFFLSFFVLVWRLFDLTVIRGRSFRALADANRTREIILRAPRGLLLDRTGRPLAVNTPIYKLTRPCEDGRGMCQQSLSKEEGEQLLAEGLPDTWHVVTDYVRQYPLGEAAAHAVGYTGELTTEELASEYYSLRNYRQTDRVGRMGAEAVYEEQLRGRDGRELVEVDAAGTIIRTLGRKEPVAGTDVMLSLDSGIIQAAALAFPSGGRGAIVVSVPNTGEILALYSSPSFSPNAFASGLSPEAYEALVSSPDRPMFNRSIGGVYPPGSTFKIVTAIAALEEGAITGRTIVEDTGVIHIPPFTFPNWYFLQYGKTEGSVDVVKAIKRSNDIYFYKAGEWLGITKLAAWSRKFGIGRILGIELSGESEGLMPDPTWKNVRFDTSADREARNNEWYLGDTYHVSIGQGYLLTTPLHVNAWTNVVANTGKLCRPTILKSQKPNSKFQKETCKDLGIQKKTIELVTEGMRQACAPGGTGWPLFNFSIIPAKEGTQFPSSSTGSGSGGLDDRRILVPVACKTGTAEFGDPNDRTHAWFTVFAPLSTEILAKAGITTGSASDSGNQYVKVHQVVAGEPEIAVTVLVEGAGEGSNVAAPVARKILEEWFRR